MYNQHGDPSAPFLVTTAPRFTKGPVTSSDYLLRALGDDPSNMQKRLGDGYYEQNLVMDQVLQLTGRKTLNGGDGLSQYTALMNDAANEAARLGLQLGAPLTSAQIASLSSDIVWLVDQVVDGQHVLVPVVYLSKATADALQSDGALIAGNNVNIQSSGTVRNDGTITGTQSTAINADTLINQGALHGGQQLAIATRGDTVNAGTISGGAVSVQAGRDLINTGSVTSTGNMALVAGRDLSIGAAPVQSGGDLALVAGRDLTATASTITAVGDASLIAGNNLTLDVTGRTTRTQNGQTVQENLTHSVTRISAGGNLAVVAGNDLVSQGAQLKAGNQLGVAAGHDMTLNAVTDSQSVTSKNTAHHAVTTTSTADETVHGSTLSGTNGVVMTAGQDINAVAANISSSDGAVTMHADRDINLLAGQNTHSETVDTKTTKNGVLNKKETTVHDGVDDTTAVGTVVSGKTGVALDAGHDVLGVGTTLASSAGGIAITAGDQVALLAATDTHDTDHSEKVRYSGVEWVPNPKQGTQKKDTVTSQVTAVGSTLDAAGPIVVMSGGDQTYQAAHIGSDTGTALVSGGAIHFVTATDSDTYQRDSSKHNVAYQAQDHRLRVDTSEQQTSITGPVTMAAAGGITVDVGRNPNATAEQKQAMTDAATHALRGGEPKAIAINEPVGETQDQAIARQSSQPGYQWMTDLQGQPGVTWNLVDEQHINEHQHHEGLTKAGATVVTVIASYFTAGAASAWIGSTAGASGGTFAAATATTSAGIGNAIATGVISGGVGGAVNAGSQGDDWKQGALNGAVSGGVSAGLFYEAGSLAQENNWANGSWQKVGLHMAAGGASNALTGGNFWNGALSAGFAEGTNPYMTDIPGGSFGQAAGAAASGAAASWLGGGDAGQGAITGLSGYLFNDRLHDLLGLQTTKAISVAAEQDANDAYVAPAVATWNAFVDVSTPNQASAPQGWYANSLLLGDVSVSASGMAGYGGGVQGTLGLYNAASSIGVSPVSYGSHASVDVNVLTIGYNNNGNAPLEFKGTASLYEALGVTVSGAYSPPYNFNISIDAGTGLGTGFHYMEINKSVSPTKIQPPRDHQYSPE